MDELVHDLVITEAAAFSRTGQLTVVKRARFYVGDSGPFTEDFTPTEFTEAHVKARIDSVAQKIRALTL